MSAENETSGGLPPGPWRWSRSDQNQPTFPLLAADGSIVLDHRGASVYREAYRDEELIAAPEILRMIEALPMLVAGARWMRKSVPRISRALSDLQLDEGLDLHPLRVLLEALMEIDDPG
jgi:hypothetical protein